MKQTPADLIALGQSMFTKQSVLLPLWQTMAEHFYPQRADFTFNRNIGTELAGNLVDSYPLLVSRELSDSYETLLRQGEWFEMATQDTTDYQGKAWLEWATMRQRQLILSKQSGFKRATKEGDRDHAAFGQCVISVEINKEANGLLYRNWHLRDCAWFDDEAGKVGGFVRKWNAELKDLESYFGVAKLHKDVAEKISQKKDMFKTLSCHHFIIPASMYGDQELMDRFKYVSVWIDTEHGHEIEAVGQNHFMYAVPRFQTIAGSPYAYSPATVVGLPDARTLQAMTHTLLEAGEKYTRPPLLATHKAIRGDVDLNPDGVTWLDDQYDEKMGEALRPLMQNMGGFPIGLNLREGTTEVLRSAFFLNKLSLPNDGKERTAYEFSEIMKQYRREVLPLISPIESDYNGQLCEISFELSMQHGLMGSPYDIPESLQGEDVEFKFISPLTESEQEQKAQRFSTVTELLGQASEYDPAVAENVDFDVAFRDSVEGIKAPTLWLKDLQIVRETRVENAKQQDIIEQSELLETQANALASEQAVS